MLVYSFIVFVGFIACPIFAQKDTNVNATCPKVVEQKNFNETQYKGRWYEIKRYQNIIISGDCSFYDHQDITEGYNVTYITTDIPAKANKTGNYLLRRKFKGYYDVKINNKVDPIPHIVLETDYVKYSVAFGCKYVSAKQSTQRLSIYSRKNTLEKEFLDKALAAIKSVNISSELLVNVEQDNKKCFRSSGNVFVPAIISSVIAIMLLAKTF